MKILVDEMPAKVEDCPWSSPIKDPWKDRTFTGFFLLSSGDVKYAASLPRRRRILYGML